MESLSTVPVADRQKLAFAYDYMGRRIRKAVYSWNTSANSYNTYTSTGARYVYDGWNMIVELGLSGVSVTRRYTWGPDLSGSLQGAGGIGGLVFVCQSGSTYYPAYDGNGNVVAMVKSDGTVAASYDYSPYGELLASTGTYAGTNPFRFSTKYTDTETNLSYFGYRYYNPETGRWLNRDPIEENGGENLYHYVFNNPMNNTDYLGFACCGGTYYDPTIGYCCGTKVISYNDTTTCCFDASTSTTGTRKAHWQLIGAKSAFDCANRIMDDLPTTPTTDVCITIAGFVYCPIGIGTGLGFIGQYLGALGWCANTECVASGNVPPSPSKDKSPNCRSGMCSCTGKGKS
jgi:RHS repeat-associated protein